MKSIVLLIFVLFQSSFLRAKENSVPAQPQETCTVQMLMTEVIGPASLDTLERSLKIAKEKKCQSLLLLVNTPGGSLSSTRKIVQEIINSEIPVLCLIYPSGAHAGSAGAIIMQACHVSGAMSATNIGAATPVASTGKEIPKDLRRKMLNDTTSWMDGITKLRERNQKFGREIVTLARAVSAEEAVKIGAIDVLAKSKKDYLNFANGRIVKLSDDKKTTVIVGSIIEKKPDLREKILKLVADPTTAYMIFMGSLGLLYFEITHPGMIVPGVVGAVGLIFALISLDKLDVMWGGLLLILLGLAFMIAEAFVPSFGILGVGGIVSFVVGSIFLFDESKTGYSIPTSMIFSTSLVLGVITLGLAYMAFTSRNVKEVGMYNDVIGTDADISLVDSNNSKKGQVRANGELWNVQSKTPLSMNDKVRIVGYKGLTLNVEIINKES